MCAGRDLPADAPATAAPGDLPVATSGDVCSSDGSWQKRRSDVDLRDRSLLYLRQEICEHHDAVREAAVN